MGSLLGKRIDCALEISLTGMKNHAWEVRTIGCVREVLGFERHCIVVTVTDTFSATGGSIVCKIETTEDENGEESEEFIPVEDDEMAEKLIEIANAQLAEEDEVEE